MPSLIRMKISKFIKIISILTFLIPEILFAGNTGKIKGTVTDADNKEPLIGVNIFILGTNRGAASDFEGNYIILGLEPEAIRLRCLL